MEDFGCSCKKCINCCWINPGWFGSTDEIIKSSKILGMSIVDFALEYLIQEWWAGDDDISIPSPRRNPKRCRLDVYKDSFLEKEIAKNGKGFKRATWGHNFISGWACIFLDENEKCKIHKSKPKECRESFGCRKNNFSGRKHIKNYWKEHQDFIKLLLFN